MSHFEPPIHWADHEDIAMKLYERFGDDFTEAKIYRIRFTDLLEWILETPNFAGTREQIHAGGGCILCDLQPRLDRYLRCQQLREQRQRWLGDGYRQQLGLGHRSQLSC